MTRDYNISAYNDPHLLSYDNLAEALHPYLWGDF